MNTTPTTPANDPGWIADATVIQPGLPAYVTIPIGHGGYVRLPAWQVDQRVAAAERRAWRAKVRAGAVAS